MRALLVFSRTGLSLAALALGVVMLASATVRAAGWPEDSDAAAPCRPTIACTADLVAPGTFEVETGFIYRALAAGATQRSTPFLLKLTLAKWAQIQVGSNGYTLAQGDARDSAARFFDNVAVTAKLHLLDQTEKQPSLAISGTVAVPTWSGQEGYTRIVDASAIGYLSKDVGPIHGDFNAGIELWSLGDHPRPQGFAALALSTPLGGPFAVALEGYAFSSALPAATRDGGVLMALTHSPRKWLTFDLGGDVGLFQSTRKGSVFVGMTVIPAVFWR